METGWPVELPRAQLHVELGQRRHRRLTASSGLLLFVCLFLPAVHSCGSDVYPIEMPYFWHPYLFGAALAIAALAKTARGVRRARLAFRVLAALTVAGATVLGIYNVALGLIELVFGLVLLAIHSGGEPEKRMAGSGIVISIISILWFGLWAGSSGALVGVYVALGASIFLLAGALLWLSEI